MTITNNVTMDFQRQNWPGPVTIHAVQGEKYTRSVEISLYSGGLAWNIPEGTTVAVRYGKPDGTNGHYDVLPNGDTAWSVSENVVTIILCPQMLTCPGTVLAQVELINDNELLSTFNLSVKVEADPSSGATTSEDYINGNVDLSGYVKTVNGQAPDENGNVTVDVSSDSGGNVDLTGYATEQFVRDGYQPKGEYLTEVPEGYAKSSEIPTKPEDIGAQPSGDYAMRSEIPIVPANVSAFTNDAGYLTEHQDLSGYAKIAETVSVKAQTLTDDQKTQARENIDAVSQADFDTLVEGLTAKPGIVSDNKFDNVFDETGKIDFTTGENATASTIHRTSGYHELWDGFDGTIYVGFPSGSGVTNSKVAIFFYDESKSYIGYLYSDQTITPQLGDINASFWTANTIKNNIEAFKTARFYRVYKLIDWDVPIYISPVTQPSADEIDYTYEYSEGGETGKITITAEKKLTGKVVVNFGDSIFGKRRPPEDISTKLAYLTGATVHNCGFAGVHMSNHWATTYNAFSMCNLVDAIVSKNWTSQDTAVADTSSNAVPSYFSEGLGILKELDFSKVDIVTIAYGTNDFTSGDTLDNSENAYDKESFAGALRYSIEKLLTAYPNLKIFICSQTYRFWMDDSYVFTEDSDTYQNVNGVKLTDFVAKTEEIAKEYHLPFIDNYYGLGFNKFNRTVYFRNSQGAVTDGTHPNAVGCRLIAEHMTNELF